MIEKILSLLGMARRAGKLSLGHDAVINSIVKNNAKLVLTASDASERLKKEFAHACTFDNKNITFAVLDCDSQRLSKAVGIKLSSLSVNDEGFAAAICKAMPENTDKP